MGRDLNLEHTVLYLWADRLGRLQLRHPTSYILHVNAIARRNNHKEAPLFFLSNCSTGCKKKHWYEEVRDIVCFYKDNFYKKIGICVQTLNNVDKEVRITFCTLEFYIFTIINKIFVSLLRS
jgi:hypothetical protein